MPDRPPSIDGHYDTLAPYWGEISTGPAKEHVLRPALESLLPAVNEAAVLDAGCGDGSYAARLADWGASVVGVDASSEMIEVARESYGSAAEFHQGDLSEPLDFLDTDSFDVVLCQHVFSHLPSLEPPLETFARVLRPGGTLVVSTHHPLHDYLVVRDREYPDTHQALGMDLDPLVIADDDAPAYHETERFDINWGGEDGENPGTYYRRPLSGLLQPILTAGFDLQSIVEPEPDAQFVAEYPDLAAELRYRPSRGICLKAELVANS